MKFLVRATLGQRLQNDGRDCAPSAPPDVNSLPLLFPIKKAILPKTCIEGESEPEGSCCQSKDAGDELLLRRSCCFGTKEGDGAIRGMLARPLP